MHFKSIVSGELQFMLTKDLWMPWYLGVSLQLFKCFQMHGMFLCPEEMDWTCWFFTWDLNQTQVYAYGGSGDLPVSKFPHFEVLCKYVGMFSTHEGWVVLSISTKTHFNSSLFVWYFVSRILSFEHLLTGCFLGFMNNFDCLIFDESHG